MKGNQKILVLTPIKQIPELREMLENLGEVLVMEDASYPEAREALKSANIVFTNPNRAQFILSADVLRECRELKTICTASTGTNHIDLAYADRCGIRVLSLRYELETIEKISSTAELALALMLASIRRIVPATLSVADGRWDYLPFVGRQVSDLKVGTVGYGRLGRKFLRYAQAMGADCYFYDPFVDTEEDAPLKLPTIDLLFKKCDVVSVHIHADDENLNLISERCFGQVEGEFHLVNTSRGGVVDEKAVYERLRDDPEFFYSTDVLNAEISGNWPSPLNEIAAQQSNILITPHIGGMTREAQGIAYRRAAQLLKEHLLPGAGV